MLTNDAGDVILSCSQIPALGSVLPIKLYDADRVTHMLRVVPGALAKLQAVHLEVQLDGELAVFNAAGDQ